ncbi:DUF5916 domain-containing protein [Shewanella waksmanii]|uniref:carbohydrate binding family 9 domain-containing protein n=1 Tax=Shewanella waksmanii TaxID=213783 RepID=UPI003735C533
MTTSFSCRILAGIFASCLTTFAIAGNHEQFTIEIPTLTTEATIDGDLSDPVWQQASKAKLKYETSPGENIKAPVDTEALIYATNSTLYVAFIADDPEAKLNPNIIRSNYSDRDDTWGDDLVGIKLDTFNDARLAYQFFINPFGVQMDSIENELTGDESDAWDGIWYSAAKQTEHGYQVEVALPLRLFNFDNKLDIQQWGIEFIRFYPRSQSHRLSTHKIDRDNNCQLCQLGVASGLSGAQTGNVLQLTPSIVANRQSERELNPTQPWQDEDNIEAGLDVRWGITPSTLLSATINPDFSQVEADAGQLNINSTFALFFPEKRAFFLDNKDYFDTQVNLLHTRNIVSPDFGAKLTSKIDNHTFGLMLTNDTETNFLVPGNLSSDIATLNDKSINLVGRYRADISNELSIGSLITGKKSDNYHNYVASADLKYQPTPQDTLTAQYVFSNTLYPEELYQQFCENDDCLPNIGCDLSDCGINERVLRTQHDDEIQDDFYKIRYVHERRNWFVLSQYQSAGKDFRADLGFIDKVDISKFVVGGGYIWYPEQQPLHRIELSGDWDISHNQNGAMIERESEIKLELEGDLQSYTAMGYVHRDRVGRRIDSSSLAIEGNTDLFTEKLAWLYSSFTPISPLKLALDINYGDAIDFSNNRLGEEFMINPEVEWKVNHAISLDASHIYQNLNVDGGELFNANLTDLRLNWYLNLNHFIRVSSIYTQIERDPSLYLYHQPKAKFSQLGNEVLYGYKLNPQSVFYLGYSDGLVSNDDIDKLTHNERTYFMKVSYAWLL